MTSIPPETPDLQDGEKLFLGDDREFSIRKENNQLIFRDEVNNNDIPVVETGDGDLLVTDAETLQGNTPSELGTSTSEIQEQALAAKIVMGGL